jgi:HTH-type transcriptional repressor of NAD biosynthesis genes
MTKAFLFGKFLPFHRGHEAMITFALNHCDLLTVLICCSDKEPIAASVRKAWIEETFQHKKNLEVKTFDYSESELPNTSASSKAISEIWSNVFKKLFRGYSLVISSEPYGDYIGEFMGIQHIPFDIHKSLVPISATAVRKDLPANWKFLPTSVRKYFSVKVVILGTESTGKTILTEKLAKHFNCSKVMEAGREIIENSNSFSIEDLHTVAKVHAQQIENAVSGDSPVVIIDTDIFITKSYCRFMFKQELEVEEKIYESNFAKLYLYLDNDVEYFQDGTRLSLSERNLLDQSHRQVLKENNISFVEISGNWEERFNQAVKHINQTIAAESILK